MSKEDIAKMQTCVLRVNVHCDGCAKKIKKTIHKINGVYHTSIDAEQGKVTVSGSVDPATIVKKLNRAGKPAALWGGKPGVLNQLQKLQLSDAGGGKGQPKDAGGKGQKGGGGGGGGGNQKGGTGGGSGGGGKDAKMVLPQPTPQQLQQLQMKGLKLPQFMGGKMPFAAPAAPAPASAKDPKAVRFTLPEDDDFEDDGSDFDDEFDEFDDEGDFEDDGLDDDFYNDPKMMAKPVAMPPAAGWGDKKGGAEKGGGGGNEIPVQHSKGNGHGNNGGGKNSGPPNNAKGGGAPAGWNHPGQGKKGGGAGGAGVGGPTGSMPPQQGMVRPNMGFSGTGQMGMMQQGGGGAMQGIPAPGYYQGGANAGGGMPAGNPMARQLQQQQQQQQQYMALMQQQQQQQQQQMMMNGQHAPYGHGHHGGAGYPAMGYGYGYGRPPVQYPTAYHAMPGYPSAEHYGAFSDENTSSCSVM